jgi:hypothetical protein
MVAIPLAMAKDDPTAAVAAGLQLVGGLAEDLARIADTQERIAAVLERIADRLAPQGPAA